MTLGQIWDEVMAGAEYKAYHRNVVEACCKLMGEESRSIWDTGNYVIEFFEGTAPEDVAKAQADALDAADADVLAEA